MKLILNITSENEAFEHAQGRTETGYLLRQVASRIESYEDEGPLSDTNGNTVGSYRFEPTVSAPDV